MTSPFFPVMMAAAAAAAKSARAPIVAPAMAAASSSIIARPMLSLLPPPTLSDEQLEVRRRVLKRESLFVFGHAGSGKSFTLRAVREAAESMLLKVGVTALTGIAGTNIGGITLHSFLGIGDGSDSVDVIVNKLKKAAGKKQQLANCMETDILIIDEISMTSAALWEKIDQVLRRVRSCSYKPFGGLTVLSFGDFAQLPPVFPRLPPGASNRVGAPPADKRLLFESSVWQQMFPVSNRIRLTKIYRQKDEVFLRLLQDLRVGRVSDSSWTTVRGCCRPLKDVEGIQPTILYSTRNDVDAENQSRLNALPGEAVVFTAKDHVFSAELKGQEAKVDSLFQARRRVELKVDAQVMLIMNKDAKMELVNGSRGRVVSINKKDETITVVFVNGLQETFKLEMFELKDARGSTIVIRMQLPFILAWACTIHKSQGMTLDRVKMDLSQCFENGQVYVSVSRAKTLEGLQITGMDASRVRCDPRVKKFMVESGELEGEEKAAAPVVAAKQTKPKVVAAAASSSSAIAAAAAASTASSSSHAGGVAWDWSDNEDEVDMTTPTVKQSIVPHVTNKRKSPCLLSDADVLAWYVKQNGTTLEAVRLEASKRIRKE